MSIKANDVAIVISLIEIATKAYAMINKIKADNPEVYAAVGQHHADALARLERAAAGAEG